MKDDRITMAHGNGGKYSQELIGEVFIDRFSNAILDEQNDSATLIENNTRLTFTTDSYTVKPIFFSGGDIGKLAVTGTINDLAVMGARPKYLSVGIILEEGFEISQLKRIVSSMQETAHNAGVLIVTGDTKVVERGSADGIFINTSGIGVIENPEINFSAKNIVAGDSVIINGTIGDHGTSIILARDDYPIETDIMSDCAPLNDLISKILERVPPEAIRVMRDPTRGGLGTTLNEFITQDGGLSIVVEEAMIPIDTQVRAVCEMTGFDPLYLANEGKVIIVSDPKYSKTIVEVMRSHSLGTDASIIGEVSAQDDNKIIMRTISGGSRIIGTLLGNMLPRIC